MSALTLEKLRAMQRLLKANDSRFPAEIPLARIVVTSDAVKQGERLFPRSRHRSRRVRKKLIRRFGGEFRMLPAIWRMGDTILVHPALAREVEHLSSPQRIDPFSGLLTGVPMIWREPAFLYGGPFGGAMT